MKAGTAQKLILNMISTGIMIKMGRVKNNMMIFMNPSNIKLYHRAQRIVSNLLNIPIAQAKEILDKNSGNIKDAVDTYQKTII